jgi:hypothetical protein
MSSSPINGLWFRRFREGCHRRMGDVWHPDRQLTIEALLASLSLLEDDWKERYEAMQSRRMEIELLAASLVIGFCGVLRGEEIPKADLEYLSKRLAVALAHSSSPHVPVALFGRFKRQVGVNPCFEFGQNPGLKATAGRRSGIWILCFMMC